METDYLPEEGEYESGRGQGEYESYEGHRKPRIRDAVEGLSEPGTPGSLSEIYFGCYPRAHVTGRSK